VGAFHVVYYNINYTYGAFNARYLSCSAPVANDSYVYTKSTCPDHSKTGSPCTCDDSYVPGPDGKSCIPETYTIALSGLGGNDVMPTETRDAYAKVTKRDGSAKSGVQVTLILTVEPEDDGQPYGAHVGSISPNGGATETDGKLNFTFTAPVAGGTHTVHAGCVNCTNVDEGKIKVPWCSVDDLPPITDSEVQTFEDNPDLSDTARLTPRMKTALSCLLRDAAAGSPSVGSAYRPLAYNQHLIDVWEKWVYELEGNEEPACAALKTKIQGHFQRHKLLETQPPVVGSLHTLGEAVDVTISLPPANIDTLAAGCQLRRSVPVKDPVHFIHQ